MASHPRQMVAPHVYLERERIATIKSEYINGEIYAMAGASEAHNLIVTNTIATLHGLLKGRGCRIYSNDMRVKVPATLLYTYPDVVIVCGRRLFDDSHQDTLINPVILMEVLSPSTEAYDRGEKFAHYRRLESLQEYILIAQDKMRVEQYVRQTDGSWNLRIAEEPFGRITLEAIEGSLEVHDLYDQVFDDDQQR